MKAIAGGLALMLAASLVVPATAKADDVLLTTAAGKVLVITQDMVDADGECVLSGESFDKVILPNDVEIDCLYVDGCEIGELNVVSGNNPEVQLWEAKIANVTVTPAELVDENAALKEYLSVMEEGADVAAFFKDVQATNKRLASLVPELSFMDAAQDIAAVTLSGNAKVDFTEGKAPGAFNIAYATAQSKMDVTVEGYNGEINVNQTTATGDLYGFLNIKTKSSNVTNVNVKSQGNANIALRPSGSKLENVTLASAGAQTLVTLAGKTENLKIASTANGGTVRVLDKLGAADVQGNGSTLELGPSGYVADANIAGYNNFVTGTGSLGDCTIPEGSSASIQIIGAAVIGNNTYQPLAVDPVEYEVEVPDGPTSTVEQMNVVLTAMQPEAVTVAGNKATITDQWKTAVYAIPASIKSRIESFKVTVSSNGQFCMKVVDDAGTILNGDEYPNYGATADAPMTFTKEYTFDVAVNQLEFMSLGDLPLEIEVSVECTLKPMEAPALTLLAMQPEAVTVDGNKATITDQWKTAFYAIPADFQDKIASVDVTVSSNGQFCIKVVDDAGTILNGDEYPNYGATPDAPMTFTKQYSFDAKITQIEFMSLGDLPLELTIQGALTLK